MWRVRLPRREPMCRCGRRTTRPPNVSTLSTLILLRFRMLMLLPGVYMLKSALPSGKYLDIRCAEKTDGAPAQTWVGNKTHAQMFSIARLGNGLYTLKAVHSGKALDADLGWLLPGHEVHQWDAYASENQQWAICSNEDGTVTLLNAANGLALDVEGANDGDARAS